MSTIERVLVTGGTGFVGSAVCRLLLNQGRQVAVLMRDHRKPGRLESLYSRLVLISGDMSFQGVVVDSIEKFEPQGVIHLAWDGVKGADRNDPRQIENVSASLNLYRLSESLDVKAFVGMGSQAEYGRAAGRLNELAPTHPTTTYGAAKLATGVLLENLAANSGRRLAWLRLFSSYGPGDDPSWMLQYLARTLLAGGRPALTAAEQIWDYIHVDDVARAVVASLDTRAHGIFNLGSGRAQRLADVICNLRDLIDPALPLGFGEVSYRPDQVMHLEADISTLQKATGWAPQVELDVGLNQVVNWLRHNS